MTKFTGCARSLLALPALLVIVLLGQSLTASPAAAVGTPGGLSPVSGTVSQIPTLGWSRVPSATSYTVELSTSSTFTPTLWSSRTVNKYSVPTVQLPAGTIYWRVRATAGTTVGSWASGQFQRSAIPAPSGLTPASGSVLTAPSSPPVLSWTPYSGATGYTVQVSTTAQFGAGTTSTTVKANSFLAPSLSAGVTYYWRVKANLSTTVSSDWSVAQTVAVTSLGKPALTGPANSPLTKVDDVVLDWTPVIGAAAYDLQVSTSSAFTTTVVNLSNVTGTSYAPVTSLNNGQYYWRVRPVDGQGLVTAWTTADVWTFTRAWSAQPTLEVPGNGSTAGDPFYYQWTPVKLADRYTIQLSTAANFSAAAMVDECTTALTTFVPTGIGDCYPNADGTYYWRVLAQDNPRQLTTDAAAAQIGSFTYRSTKPTLVAPGNGATLAVPTLTWSPVDGAAKYLVSIEPVNPANGGGGVFFTTATSFTPRYQLAAGVQYRWQVQTVSVSGRIGSTTTAASQRTFTVGTLATPTSTTPDPLSAPVTSARFPTLTWKAVVDADYYKIQIRPQGSSTWSFVEDTFSYPVGEDDTTDWLVTGTYEWRVQAYKAGAPLSTSVTTSTFTISAVPAATGQRVAMTGQATASSPTWCGLALPSTCTNLRQTPVLAWNAAADAAFYKVYVAKDVDLTTMVIGYPKIVESPRIASTLAVGDNQPGETYYWYVQPCKAATKCALLTSAAHAFTKTSKPVQLLQPANDSTVANEVSFAWRDYLATNQDASAFPVSDGTGLPTVASRVGAKQYRIQVSTVSDFATVMDNVVVDQAAYTPFSVTYPEGDLYWRVRAIDGSSNELTWSSTFHLVKTLPATVPTAPVSDAATGGFPVFRWEPRAFAASYTIEVFKNGDTSGATTSRVITASTKQAAYVPTAPLPVSASPYVWRVRVVDVKGRPGSWSDLTTGLAQFSVVGSPVSLVAPAPGVFVKTNEVVFGWTATPDATTYKLERRKAGATSASPTTTPALGWAATIALTTGTWEWRVSSVDAGGKVIAATPWSTFKVDATPPKVKAYTPTGLVPKGTSFTVTFSEPVTNVTANTLTITPATGSNALDSRVTLSDDGLRGTLNPDSPLIVGKKYVVKVSTGVADEQGNKMARAFTWTVTAK